MSILEHSTINPYLHNSQLYNLAISKNKKETLITMSLITRHLYTNSLPKTHSMLKTFLPGVLKTKCYNEDNLPFTEEVKNTEIGHLFEHILLENLCESKLVGGHKKASFRGVTKWNWNKDSKGTYHITIYMGQEDSLYFKDALDKSMKLLNTILSNQLSLN